MKLLEAFAALKSTFPTAVEISSIQQVNQNGLYLYFDGIKNSTPGEDSASFVLLVAGNSLNKDAASALAKIEEVRTTLFELGVANMDNYFRGVKAAEFTGSSLFVYAVLISIKIQPK